MKSNSFEEVLRQQLNRGNASTPDAAQPSRAEALHALDCEGAANDAARAVLHADEEGEKNQLPRAAK